MFPIDIWYRSLVKAINVDICFVVVKKHTWNRLKLVNYIREHKQTKNVFIIILRFYEPKTNRKHDFQTNVCLSSNKLVPLAFLNIN